MSAGEAERDGRGEVVRAQASVSAEVATGVPRPTVERKEMSEGLRAGIAVGILVLATLLIVQLLAIWPAVMRASANAAAPETTILFGNGKTRFDNDVVLLLMVVIVGALAALMGVSRRFLYYAHRDQLTTRDAWSYVLRPFQGALLALLVYFTLRGGFLGQDASAPINPYGVAATAGLVGLFTRHAVSRLGEIFDAALGKPTEDRDEPLVDDGGGGGGPSRDARQRRDQHGEGAKERVGSAAATKTANGADPAARAAGVKTAKQKAQARKAKVASRAATRRSRRSD